MQKRPRRIDLIYSNIQIVQRRWEEQPLSDRGRLMCEKRLNFPHKYANNFLTHLLYLSTIVRPFLPEFSLSLSSSSAASSHSSFVSLK